MKVKTKDLYCAAYITSCGGTLEEVTLAEDGRRGRSSCVTFILSGENVDELSKEFLKGQANANLASFKNSMHQLKEMMFDVINNAPR